MDSSIEYKRATLQEELDRTPEGGICTLYHSENPGPLVIRKAITVECINVTICSTSGPVLKILSPGVVLKNLRVEVTSAVLAETDTDCAIQVAPGATVKFDNIVVRGSILGVKGEEGIWRYPNSLFLGNLAYGEEHIFTLHICVPVSCRLKSGIQGIDFQPNSLEPGFHEIKLTVENGVSRDTVINGTISIITGQFTRHIWLNGHVSESKQASPDIVLGRGQVLWEPPNWAVLTAPPIKTQKESRVPAGPSSGPQLTNPDSLAPPMSELPPPPPAQSEKKQSEPKPDGPVIKKFPSPRINDPPLGETIKKVGVPTEIFLENIRSKRITLPVDTTPITPEKEKPGLGEIFKPTSMTSKEFNNPTVPPNLTEQKSSEVSSSLSEQPASNETTWTTPRSTPIKSPPIKDSIFLKSITPKVTSPSTDTISDGDQLGKDENQILSVADLSNPSPKSDALPDSAKSRKRIVKQDATGSFFSRKDKNNTNG